MTTVEDPETLPEEIVHWQPNDRPLVEPRVGVATAGAATGSALVGALALGALALGAVAIGAMAIGALRIGRLGIGRVRLGDVAEGVGGLVDFSIRSFPRKRELSF